MQNTFNQNHAEWNFQNNLFPQHFMKTDIAICTQLTSKNKNRPASAVLRNKTLHRSEYTILVNAANFICTRSTIKLKKKSGMKN